MDTPTQNPYQAIYPHQTAQVFISYNSRNDTLRYDARLVRAGFRGTGLPMRIMAETPEALIAELKADGCPDHAIVWDANLCPTVTV